jgi:thiamine-monophosphate kinase
MGAKSVGEFEAIELLRREHAKVALGRRVALGIGDDAAVLRAGGESWVWTLDSSVEGVHFDLAWCGLRQAAERAFVAALSDVAAMAAAPLAALCALSVPSGATRAQISAVARGQRAAGQRYACPVVGGNITRDTHWAFATTVLGVANGVVSRSGALPGDEIWLIGTAGEAAAGLAWLKRASKRGARLEPKPRSLRRCVRAFLQPQARIEEGLRSGKVAHALLDVSDGVASECWHLAKSSGVRVVLDSRLLLDAASSELRAACRELELDPLELMLFGGEDYALLAAGPAAHRPQGARVLGHVVAGRGAWLRAERGLAPLGHGHDHLAARHASVPAAAKRRDSALTGKRAGRRSP